MLPDVHAKLLQSCQNLCDPMDHSPPGFSVHGILQVRILEWVTVFFLQGSLQPRDQTRSSYISYIDRQVFFSFSFFLPLASPGKTNSAWYIHLIQWATVTHLLFHNCLSDVLLYLWNISSKLIQIDIIDFIKLSCFYAKKNLLRSCQDILEW